MVRAALARCRERPALLAGGVALGTVEDEWAGVTATVDRDTGRLTRVVTRTVRRGGHRFRHVTVLEYGVDVRRPAGAGAQGPVSLAWDAAVY